MGHINVIESLQFCFLLLQVSLPIHFPEAIQTGRSTQKGTFYRLLNEDIYTYILGCEFKGIPVPGNPRIGDGIPNYTNNFRIFQCSYTSGYFTVFQYILVCTCVSYN